MNLHRRALVLTSLFSASFPWPLAVRAHAARTQVSMDDFVALAAHLSGRAAATLDHDMASRILQVLVQQGKADGLLSLIKDSTSNPELANDVLAAWYSGQVTTQSGTSSIGFPHALVWSAAPFLHVPGTCGGATNYWANAPAV